MEHSNHMQEKLPNETAVLVMGIISVVCILCCAFVSVILGIIGLVMGNTGMKLYDNAPEQYLAKSYSNMKIGKILSVVGLVGGVLYLAYNMYLFSSNPEMFQEIMDQINAGAASGGNE